MAVISDGNLERVINGRMDEKPRICLIILVAGIMIARAYIHVLSHMVVIASVDALKTKLSEVADIGSHCQAGLIITSDILGVRHALVLPKGQNYIQHGN